MARARPIRSRNRCRNALAAFIVFVAASASAAQHSLDFEGTAGNYALSPVAKRFDEESPARTDQVFRDGVGREVILRGWNVSGNSKLAQSGFLPFRSIEDANASLAAMTTRTGANAVRFVIAWEGTNPTVDQVDSAYLDALIAQVRVAISYRLYVLLDFHQDLFSRYLFAPDAPHTGNGAPLWVIRAGGYGQEFCPECVAWAQHSTMGTSVRAAARDFWTNRTVHTDQGDRAVQDSFLAQLGATLAYIRQHLSADEWAFVLGVDPWNEPIDGGLANPPTGAERWENDYLWPFYRRVRALMDQRGWGDKLVFAEPLVFWNAPAPLGTGGAHLHDIPKAGFAFNPHFYDMARMAPVASQVLWAPFSVEYFGDMQRIREEARYLRMPVFVSEFGALVQKPGGADANRILAGLYQALETSDSRKVSKDRFADTYSPPLSGTQWHWDIYYGQHGEMRGGTVPVKEGDGWNGDAWNGEGLSAVRSIAAGPRHALWYNFDATNIQRIAPRRVQGEVVSFHFSARVPDASGKPLDWLSLRPVVGNTEYLSASRWALLVWRGRTSDAPTELFIPEPFDPAKLAVITDAVVVDGLMPREEPNQTRDEVMAVYVGGGKLAFPGQGGATTGGSHRLLVWDDMSPGENLASRHYVLIVVKSSADALPREWLSTLKAELDETILRRHVSPVYFMGDLPPVVYPADQPAAKPFQLSGRTYKFVVWPKADFSWDGALGRVAILLNGRQVDTGDGRGSRSFWALDGPSTYQVCELGERRCSNAWTAPPP